MHECDGWSDGQNCRSIHSFIFHVEPRFKAMCRAMKMTLKREILCRTYLGENISVVEGRKN